jgi:hypothetical protein
MALDEDRPTSKRETTHLVDHDTTPPHPLWPAALARLVDLLIGGSRSVDWLTRRFFGAGAKPRDIVEQMLLWLDKLGLVAHDSTADTYRLLTRSDVERASEAAEAWHNGDLAQLLTDLNRYTGIQQELKAGGDELRAKLRELTTIERLETFQTLGQVLGIGSASIAEFSDAQRACWAALGLLLDFKHRWMDAGRLAQGEALAQDVQRLEEHVRNKDIAFRDRADAHGAFVKRLEKRVSELHSQISAAKVQFTMKLAAAGLPPAVFDTPSEALLILTKRDQQLQHTTKGVMPSETLIHHLVQRNLRNAERCVEAAEQKFTRLNSSCEEWIREWNEFRQAVDSLAQQYKIHERQFNELAARSIDSLFVKQHLEALRARLKSRMDDAADLLQGLQDVVDGDYAEQVKAKDHGGPPYDQNGTAVLLQEARKLIRDFTVGPTVSTERLRELLEPLVREKAVYASVLMNERGTPTDPGLGLLRFAIGRLDDGAALHAERRLEATPSLRALVEEAFQLRNEWRQDGPAKLGDADLFTFFLQVIDTTDLGNQGIPRETDWEKLGKLKDRIPLTLKFA